MKRIKKVLKITLMIVFLGIVYSFFFTTYENIKISKTFKFFKNRGEFEKEIVINKSNIEYYRRYYSVPRETSKELADKNNVFFDSEKMQLGIDGDVFATLKSPFPEKKLIHAFITYYFGGHSALLTYDANDNPRFVEAAGFPKGEETIFDYIFSPGDKETDLDATAHLNNENYWQNPTITGNDYFGFFYRDQYFGLRASNPFVGEGKQEKYDEYIKRSVELGLKRTDEDRLYNFLFFLNMKNKYYCSDLMSRTFDDAYNQIITGNDEYRSKGYGKKMNDDGFITSIQDLTLSRDTLLTFYVEIKEEIRDDKKVIVEHLYYLADIN